MRTTRNSLRTRDAYMQQIQNEQRKSLTATFPNFQYTLLIARLGRHHRFDVVKRLREPHCGAPSHAAPANGGLHVGWVADEAGDRSLKETCEKINVG